MSARSGDHTALAVSLLLLALTLFTCMGLIVKLLAPRYSAAELSAYRNIFGLVPGIVALWSSRAWHVQGRPIMLRQWPLAMFRGIAVALAQLLFYISLGTLAFATATTISNSNALFVTALAVPLLNERVGWVRWSAVIVGFVGVVMVMGPGRDAFSVHAILPAGAAAFYALTGVTARMFDPDVSTPLMNLWSSAIATVGTVALVLGLGGFSPIETLSDLSWIVAMGLLGGGGVLGLIVAFRMTEQSNLAPFTYFSIPLAFLFGWMFFGEAPFDDLFPGAVLIVAGGLLIVWREGRRK